MENYYFFKISETVKIHARVPEGRIKSIEKDCFPM